MIEDIPLREEKREMNESSRPYDNHATLTLQWEFPACRSLASSLPSGCAVCAGTISPAA
jgi:hypothetical protein